MIRKKILLFFFLFIILTLVIFYIYKKFDKKVVKPVKENNISDEIIYNANIINNVNYTTKDANGNEYIITALKGKLI